VVGIEGKRHPGARHYFDCGGVILAVLDPTQGGLTPTPGPKSLYFAVTDLDAVHKRATELGALAPYKVHGVGAGTIVKRPWGERSFYVVDKGATTCASSRTAPCTRSVRGRRGYGENERDSGVRSAATSRCRRTRASVALLPLASAIEYIRV
jgi:hypothetical protein